MKNSKNTGELRFGYACSGHDFHEHNIARSTEKLDISKFSKTWPFSCVCALRYLYCG